MKDTNYKLIITLLLVVVIILIGTRVKITPKTEKLDSNLSTESQIEKQLLIQRNSLIRIVEVFDNVMFNEENKTFSVNESVIMAAPKTKEAHSFFSPYPGRFYCGNGNEYVNPCVFYLEKSINNGGPKVITKIAEWPNQSLISKYPDQTMTSMNNFFVGNSLNMKENSVYFTTKAEYGCNDSRKQYWVLDLNTGNFILDKEDREDNYDGC